MTRGTTTKQARKQISENDPMIVEMNKQARNVVLTPEEKKALKKAVPFGKEDREFRIGGSSIISGHV
jgi:hypothetical protein